jgi:uncharacterized membrane protein YeaQ/YmgE (transglycosylase-associated protein family)
MIEPLLDVLLSPALWLSLALGGACGLLFHIWRRGGWRWLLGDLLVGMLGFAAGQMIAGLLQFDWLRIGQVRVLPGVVGAVVFLMACRLLLSGGMAPRAPVTSTRRRA